MVKIGRNLLVFLLATFGFVLIAQAEVSVTATVDRNQMGVGDTFTLTVSVSSSESLEVDEPRLPDLTGFELINSWPQQLTQASFVNGKFSTVRTKNFNYMLATKQMGKFEIEAIEMVVDGQKYLTKPIVINVAKNSSAPPPSQEPQQGHDPFAEMEDMFGRLLQRRGQPNFRSQPLNPKEAFFIQVEADKTQAYEGEQITVSWYLYTRGQISDIDTLKYPSLNGFWKEDIEVSTRLNFTSEVVNGVPYKKALLASYALFPIKAGKAVIDAYKARCTVVTPSAFGFGKPYKYTKTSKEVKIDVLPIPKDGRPNDFTGAVGQFNVSASLDTKKVPVNQPISLKVRFDGKGNAKLIDLPALNLPNSIEVYDTKKEQKFFKNGRSYREFEVLLIPREVGQAVVPEMSVSIFDPDRREFYSRQTPPISFEVVPGAGDNAIPSSPLSDNQDGLPEQLTLPPLILSPEHSAGFFASHGGVIWPVVYLLGFAFLGWRGFAELGMGRKQKSIEEVVKEKFRRVNEKLAADDWRGVGVEVMNCFYFLVGEISGEGGANLKIEELIAKAPPSVRREMGEELLKILKVFEVVAFAPEGVVGKYKNSDELKKQTQRVEAALYKSIKLGLGRSVEEKSNS